jgi:3-oxoacyl-(acyl-carrier-protein) synthase
MSGRTVITGIGIVAPTGIGADDYWKATQEGRSGIKRISRFDPSSYTTQLAGEVDGFHAADYLPPQLMVQTDRSTWMALAATQMALKDAAFDPSRHEPYRMSVVTASSSGGNEFGQREIQNLWGKGPLFVGAYQSIAWFYAASTGQISIRHGMKGPNGVIVTEGAGGLDALQHSRRTIRRGVDVVVSGGTEAPIGPYALVCQMRNGLLSAKTDPAAAYRPFDAAANGYVPGEGGAIFLVESLEHARRRGALHVYGEIAGYAATQDGYHHARPAPDGRQLTRAIALALEDAGVEPRDVDVIFADAVGVPKWDALEARAIKDVFGGSASRVPVTAPKTMVGRLYAGGASLDVATALLAIRDARIPPTVNFDRPADGCDLHFITGKALAKEIKTVLIIARGFGGFNSALVLRKCPGWDQARDPVR